MSKNKDSSIKYRLIFSIFFSFFVFLALIYQLYTIQIIKSEGYIREATLQRSMEFPIYPKRGIIFDRNLIPITNNTVETTIIIEKDKLVKDKALYKQVLKGTNLKEEDLNKMINSNKQLLQLTIQNKDALRVCEDFFKVEIVKRYQKDNPLAHVVGYINKSDNKGKSGIEFVQDEFLRNQDRKSYLIEYDRDRKIILGSGPYEENSDNPMVPNSVQLTIDIELQKYIEKLLDKENYKGAVVVTEVSSGDILSLVSRPNFNQDDVERYFQIKDMSLYNKAIQVGYPPGSVFKTVVLLAALEENMNYIDTKFYCNGYENVNGLDISCTSNHGLLSLREAFAKSCNSAFIQLGKKIGPKRIIEMASKLGMGSKIDIGLIEEIGGRLPNDSEIHGAAIGNIAIGQGIIEVTPIQITNLMMILANKGVEKAISITKAITNQEGRIIKEYQKTPSKRVLEEGVANIALAFLKEVINQGTARSIKLSDLGGGGGKTGSAQAVLDGQDTIHGWFSGFYPSDNPKYVITILIENSNTGSKITLPVFEDIVRKIHQINNN